MGWFMFSLGQKQLAHSAVDVTAQFVPYWLGSWGRCNFWTAQLQCVRYLFISLPCRNSLISFGWRSTAEWASYYRPFSLVKQGDNALGSVRPSVRPSGLPRLRSNFQHTFNTFVRGKLLGPTFLGSPTLRTVGVRVTFSLLLWKFCWTYRFWLPNSKNCWETKIVGPTKFPQHKRESNSNTNSSYCWGA